MCACNHYEYVGWLVMTNVAISLLLLCESKTNGAKVVALSLKQLYKRMAVDILPSAINGWLKSPPAYPFFVLLFLLLLRVAMARARCVCCFETMCVCICGWVLACEFLLRVCVIFMGWSMWIDGCMFYGGRTPETKSAIIHFFGNSLFVLHVEQTKNMKCGRKGSFATLENWKLEWMIFKSC